MTAPRQIGKRAKENPAYLTEAVGFAYRADTHLQKFGPNFHLFNTPNQKLHEMESKAFVLPSNRGMSGVLRLLAITIIIAIFQALFSACQLDIKPTGFLFIRLPMP